MASGSENDDGSDLMMACECGAGICTVDPLLLNPRFLFVCCPRGPADGEGCGFMQWRDTVDPNNITTWNTNHNSLPPPPPPPPPPLFTGTTADTDTDTTAADTPFTAPSTTADTPPPPPQMMCPCRAGPCSIGTARNGRNFYSCSACKFIKWCDAGSSSQCYICREEGHWSMDCPRLPPSAAAAAANNKKICFYCKQEDHYAAQCPFKRPRRRRN